MIDWPHLREIVRIWSDSFTCWPWNPRLARLAEMTTT